jgi:hypothetical protein
VKISSDYKDLLRSLNAAGVRYLVVGGYAVMIYTEPSFTKDLDIWTDPTLENAQALFRALSEFGAPLKGISPRDFTEPEIFYQMGVEPVRVDVLTSLPDTLSIGAAAGRAVAGFIPAAHTLKSHRRQPEVFPGRRASVSAWLCRYSPGWIAPGNNRLSATPTAFRPPLR